MLLTKDFTRVVAGSEEIPPEPGTTPIPPDHVRLYHYISSQKGGQTPETDEQMADNLRSRGIDIGKARGHTYGEPNAVWASTKAPGHHKIFAEFDIHKDDPRWDIGKPRNSKEVDWLNKGNIDVTFQGSIKPEEIIAVHMPWHHPYRYLMENDMVPAVLSGEYDYLLDDNRHPDEAKAIEYIKSRNITNRIDGSRVIRAEWGSDGDFITPEGKIIHAGENHTIFMMKHPEMFGDSKEPDDVVDQGWIRTRTMFGTFSVDAHGGMNERQLRILQKMIQDQCRYSDPRLEVLMDNDIIYELTCVDFDEIEYPNQIKRRGLHSTRRIGQKITDYTDWKGDEEDTPEEHPYFGVGHGDYSEEHGFAPSYVVWARIGGRIEVSEPIDSESEGAETHGTLWGHDVTDRDYKGRYEPDTGRLTIVKPERQRFREIPDVLWTALRSKFKNIKEVRVF